MVSADFKVNQFNDHDFLLIANQNLLRVTQK